MRRITTVLLFSSVLFVATSVWAEKKNQNTQIRQSDDDFDDDDDWDDEDEAEPAFPRLEHRGYFRFRGDMFNNAHLGIATQETINSNTVTTSGFVPPLTANLVNNKKHDDEELVGSANMRLRYQPRLLVSDTLEINATLDIMDNVVLGSTPDFNFARYDVPYSAFSASQAPPGSGYQFEDSVRVKELWGQWKVLGMPVRFGRMASHWGLGMLANGGNHWDDDFGDYVDRVMAAVKIYGVYVIGGYDIVSSGPTYNQPFQPFGQAYDITDADDVQQGFLGIFSRPVQPDELQKRRLDLVKNHKTVFDWGLYTVFRKQKMDIEATDFDADGVIDGYADANIKYDNLTLIERDAWAVVPDLWLRLEKRWDYSTYMRLELEYAMIYGEIADISPTINGAFKDREIMSWGLAFESEFRTGGLSVGINGGAASGDKAEYLGVLDNKNLAEAGNPNAKIVNFKFDRNYRVDHLLFREVIGTITNAWYAKPYIRYDLFDSPDGAIGGRLDVLIAGAMKKEAYPGNEAYLGTEIDTTFFVENENNFYADFVFGLLIPGPAFNLVEGYKGYIGKTTQEPELAWTIQTHMVMKY